MDEVSFFWAMAWKTPVTQKRVHKIANLPIISVTTYYREI